MMQAQLTEPAPLQSVGKLMAGLFFTAAGLLLTADNLHLLDAEPYLELWPGLVIAFGVFKLLDNAANKYAAGAMILIGSWILALNLGWIRFSIFDLWPLLLIGGGLAFIIRAIAVGENATASQGNVAIFANRTTTETTRDYRGGTAFAFLGGQVIDLTAADIARSPAVLDVFAFWGGIEIRVPDDWDVVSEVTPVMGGFEMTNRASAADPKRRLVVRGAVIMAGVEVKLSPRRTA